VAQGKRSSPEFRQKAVRLYRVSERPYRAVAEEPSPGSFFNAVTASMRSPCSCSELRQVNSSCWFDTTSLRASPSPVDLAEAVGRLLCGLGGRLLLAGRGRPLLGPLGTE
jgi:hypothetical protein